MRPAFGGSCSPVAFSHLSPRTSPRSAGVNYRVGGGGGEEGNYRLLNEGVCGKEVGDFLTASVFC